jgi:hypothetical protein
MNQALYAHMNNKRKMKKKKKERKRKKKSSVSAECISLLHYYKVEKNLSQ